MEAAIQPEALAQALAQACADTKATDISILDMRGLVDYTDTFVLCSGRSGRQVSAIADAVRSVAKSELSITPLGVEGQQTGKWVLVDFGDCVVHIFEASMRGFYDLDGLWADAPRFEAPLNEDEQTAEEPRFF